MWFQGLASFVQNDLWALGSLKTSDLHSIGPRESPPLPPSRLSGRLHGQPCLILAIHSSHLFRLDTTGVQSETRTCLMETPLANSALQTRTG